MIISFSNFFILKSVLKYLYNNKSRCIFGSTNKKVHWKKLFIEFINKKKVVAINVF